ncbi:bifunctional fatty acid transporter and acyl-CoA synthetase [Mollisia scopiformis]|uniref:Bifunctional fatty acid transporter and acyl-CoA synthetase n=1 Tax=Mollisia scopiformis TaxID=149040 RepID=A0A132BAZ3_MOLSC|nr:bifunctional fatty acid transporter and acyl-CoA synthetase [Mollisia scopiformis]KUJ09443.1 bifunctional fatty acid transporter and acyl-CoA synthetase [Mollisia scopiformis]
MPRLPELPTTVAAAATLFTVGAYLNAKLGIGYDLRRLRHQKEATARIAESYQKFGSDISLYQYLEFADQDADAIWFEGKTINYRDLKAKVDALAQYLSYHGVRAGQVVGILATNSPEMGILMCAISKLGAISGMLNTALKSDTLSHCIKVANTNIVVATPDLVANVPSTIGSEPLKIFSLNLGYVGPFLTERTPGISFTIIEPNNLTNLPPIASGTGNPTDFYLLVFTSGTTGKPKAVQLPKAYLYGLAMKSPLDLENPKKYFPIRTYSCLPLFHATALLGFVSAMGNSSCFCISRKFSASNFSRELFESKANRMLYVGEVCRYLLAAPKSEFDRKHNCIVAVGNGLQKDVWIRFQERFGIQEIREIYRSSEGLYKFDNFYGGAQAAGKVGYAGLIGRILEDDTFLLKFSQDSQDLYRDPRTGFCVLAKDGEPGEAVARIRTMQGYPAYHGDKEATEKKFARDVFKKGDLFQRSGDLLVRDEDGWVRFYERIGETFRWKGENVSTGEVKGFMLELPNVNDVVVYGTKLEGYDGQVGTASIVLQEPNAAAEASYLEELYLHLRSRGLPEYAIPRLIRFTKQIDTGATFKHAKEVLKLRPWAPDQVIDDHLYWLDNGVYKPLDMESWSGIQRARAKL